MLMLVFHCFVVAYSTRRKYKRCEDDKQLESLISAGTACVTIVAKAWDLHVDHILEVTYRSTPSRSLIDYNLSFCINNG